MRRAALALLLLLAVLVSACVPTAPRQPAPAAVDTLFYISARAREDGRDVAKLADSLEYGIVLTRRPRLADPLTDAARIEILDTLPLTRAAFVEILAGCAGLASQTPRFAVLYTHGYGTSLHNLWEHAALARLRARGTQPWIVFAWPSIGSGVAWPRAGEVLTAAYRADSASAAASHAAFAQALTSAQEATGGAGLMLIAHSLGGQLVGEALQEDSILRARLALDPLRAIAFVSPDIERQRFAERIAPALRPLAQRLLLYASADDRVLFFSERVNDSERAGRIVEHAMPRIAGVESVDMTDGRYANSWLIHTLGTRHALRRKSAALFDLIHIVGAQRPPECRLRLGTAVQQAPDVWKLTSVAVPAPSDAARC